MAESLKKTRQTHPGSGCFLGCFGSSGKKKPLPKTIQTSSKKNIPFFSWPMFGCRTKTVPVDNTEKAEADSKSHTPKLIKKKSDSKLFSEPRSPTNHKPSRRQNSRADQPQASSNQAPRERPKEGPEPKIILGDRNLSDTARTGSSLPGSPKVKPKTKSKTQTKLSHAVSLPVVERNQRMANSRIHAGINLKKPQWKNSEVVEKLDPVMGMSIIMVTLVIMLLWGRLCAILCTSAWFYFCPRLRTAITNNDVTAKSAGNSNDLYLNSAEYKKKVVLEGFLERNRRASL